MAGRKKRTRRKFDEDSAIELAFEEIVGPTQDIPDYIQRTERPIGAEHITVEEAVRAFFDMGYRQRQVDAQRWRAKGPREGHAHKKATGKVRDFATSFKERRQQHPELSEKAAARTFLRKKDKDWDMREDDEQDRRVESFLRLVRRRRAARRQ